MRRSSSREKHSFIQFYFDDWKAGTAHMGRVIRSVYFDICLYSWDKGKPVSPSALMMMLSDVDGWPQMVQALVEEGALVTDSNGFVHSPRALREAERAYDAWMKKSKAGKTARGTLEIEPESSTSEQCSITDAPAMELRPTDSDSDSDSEPYREEDKDRDSILDFGRSRSLVVSAWNEMARRSGLKQVAKMTSERIACLDARLHEYGEEALVGGINLIPTLPFLLGQGPNAWRAHFDWFLRPDSPAHVIEGDYEPRPGKAAPKATGPMTDADAINANERLAEMGSGMRWQLEGGNYALKPAGRE